MKMIKFWPLFSLACLLSIVVGCATQGTPRIEVPTATLPQLTPRGTMIFNDEYEFIPPPSSFEMLTGNQFSHYVVGYYRKDSDKISLSSSFIAYDEDPFGTSRDLEIRSRECLERYFWASMFQKTILEKRKLKVLGGEGLAVTFEIKDTTKKIKVKSKLVFGYRGDRIVLFYINQWRAIDSSYDAGAFDTFDTFVKSFTFLKKSFYETL
jgi:hypothetical protein